MLVVVINVEAHVDSESRCSLQHLAFFGSSPSSMDRLGHGGSVAFHQD